MRLPLRYQVLAFICVLLVVTMSGYLLLAMRLTMRDKIAYVYEVNAAVARAKADEVHGHFTALSATLGYFVAAGACRGPNGGRSAQTLLQGDSELLGVEVWKEEAGGNIERECRVIDESRLSAAGLASDALFALRPDHVLLAQVDQNGIALRNHSVPPDAAVLTVVSRASDGRIVVMHVRPDRLLRLFEERRAYHSWLVDGQGNVLAHPDASAVVARANLLHVPIVQEALQGTIRRGVREYQDRGESFLGAWAHVGAGRLVVVTAVPRRMALSAVAELAWRTLLMGIAAVLFALLSAIFFSRRLTRPLHRLEAAVAALRAGELGVGVPIESRNEIGRLAGAFNEMSRELLERETRLNEAQARLLQADRLAVVGTLAAGVAHEINNPLTYITTNLKFALDSLARSDGPPDTTAAVREAAEGAARVREIVADLRVFSRASDESRSPVDVREVLDSAVKLVRAEISRRAVFERSDDAELPRVLANRGRLGQVFLNLLVNATQAVPEGQPSDHVIRIGARERAGKIVVEVSDTGMGIPPEIRERIFDPLFTTKPVGEGTGLGLSIVHGIVTALGGSIEVESEPGRGTTFRVILPADSAAPRDRDSSGLSGLRILAVASDPELERIAGILAEHDLVRVPGTADALALLCRQHEPFDIVLCPLRAPHLTGPDVHRELRAAGLGHEDRLVFVVDRDGTAEEWEFLESVSNEWIERGSEVGPIEAALARGSRLCPVDPRAVSVGDER